MAKKIATGSLWTSEDQIRWYREAVGDTAAERQIELAKKENKQCICKASIKERTVKRKWDGERVTARAIHELGCPKYKPWMALV